VRSLAVVVTDVDAEDALELATDDQEPVEALAGGHCRIQRSICAFAFGAWTGVRMTLIFSLDVADRARRAAAAGTINSSSRQTTMYTTHTSKGDLQQRGHPTLPPLSSPRAAPDQVFAPPALPGSRAAKPGLEFEPGREHARDQPVGLQRA